MTDETTTEQLVEIDGQTEDTPASQYTPPEGWRVLAVGERLRDGDVTVGRDGSQYPTERVGGWVGSNQQYIRRIEPQPQPESQPEPVPEPDAELRIRLLQQANDSQAETIGRLLTEARDLNMEIGGLERRLSERDARIRDLETMHAAATQAVVDAGKQNDALRLQVQNRQQEYERQKGRIEFLETLNAGNGAAIGDYRANVEKLQGLVDIARQQLEAAATEHDSLSTQLAAVKAELVTQAETSRRLQIELDAVQQVPADSPELRQLRADLEQVTQERDQYLDSYQRIFGDLETIRETTKAAAVETIVEWLVPIRTCGSQALATAVISNLPHIMRSLTGLADEEIE